MAPDVPSQVPLSAWFWSALYSKTVLFQKGPFKFNLLLEASESFRSCLHRLSYCLDSSFSLWDLWVVFVSLVTAILKIYILIYIMLQLCFLPSHVFL